MSRYAVDPQRQALIVTWPTGSGDTATTGASLPPNTPALQAHDLARELTSLSQALWRTYTHPPLTDEVTEPDSEEWQPQHEREILPSLPETITNPNLPRTGSSPSPRSPWRNEHTASAGSCTPSATPV